jgi:serine/threonine-protein kinase
MTGQLDALRAVLSDHYELERELGAGGMATVYLARDLKHDRLVAIKVLQPELAASLGVERFLREIQVTAKLSHPHILPLYDSGEAGGFLFYVMPFVEGESLADMIAREQQPANIMLSGGHAVVADFGIALAISQAGGEKLTQTGTAIGTAVYMSPEQAQGLENIDGRSDIYSLGCMLYEMLVGQVPFTGPNPQAIMARHTMDAVSPPSIIRQTISPELEDIIFTALAKSPADRFRTAGEFVEALSMLDSGTLAQQRHSRAVTAARTAHTAALERTGRKRRMPRAAVAAVSAVAAVGVGFGIWQLWPGGGTGAIGAGELDPRSVAVLYFEDLSPGGEFRFAADGLTEGLIDQLSPVRELDVVSRNGVAPFRDSELSRDSIARALKAGTLIAGSIEPLGERLSVTVRLVEGASGADFARSSLEVPAGEFLAAKDSVAELVSRFLRERLGEEIRVREQRAATTSVQAWGLVQQAERLRKDAEGMADQDDATGAAAALHRADSLLTRAEAADPGWADPIVARGWVAQSIAQLQEEPFDAQTWYEEAVAHATRAIELAGDSPPALELRGTALLNLWDLGLATDQAESDRIHQRAREDLETAVAADPTLARAQVTLSFLYYDVEDIPSALLAAQRALEEDAFLENRERILVRLFWGSMDLEQFVQARRWCTEGATQFPRDRRFVECRMWLMATPAAPADVDEAWRLDSLLDIPTTANEFRDTQGQMLVGGVLARAGLADSARRVLLRAREQVTYELDPSLYLLSVEAYLRTHLGDYDEAIDLLKRFVAANPGHEFAEAIGTVWWWREIRSHPRIGEITGYGP